MRDLLVSHCTCFFSLSHSLSSHLPSPFLSLAQSSQAKCVAAVLAYLSISRIQTVWYAPTTQQLVLLLILGLASKTQPTYPNETRRGEHPRETASTTHAQSPKRNQPSAHVICPNETVGAAPMCPPERPHSGVSIRK